MEKNIKHLNVGEVCKNYGIKMTQQRAVIAEVINNSKDHPVVEKIYERAYKKNKKISLATVYRTVKLFEEAKAVIKHEFKFGEEKARYEAVSQWEHNHLINIISGKVTEFQNPGFEKLAIQICKKKGYKMVGYKLELFVIEEACKKLK